MAFNGSSANIKLSKTRMVQSKEFIEPFLKSMYTIQKLGAEIFAHLARGKSSEEVPLFFRCRTYFSLKSYQKVQ